MGFVGAVGAASDAPPSAPRASHAAVAERRGAAADRAARCHRNCRHDGRRPERHASRQAPPLRPLTRTALPKRARAAQHYLVASAAHEQRDERRRAAPAPQQPTARPATPNDDAQGARYSRERDDSGGDNGDGDGDKEVAEDGDQDNAAAGAGDAAAGAAPRARHSFDDQSNAAARYDAYAHATRCVLAGRDHDRSGEFYTCPTGRRLVNVPVFRTSTVLFPSNAARRASLERGPGPRDRIEDGLFYGRMGTLTQRTLEEAYAALEDAHGGIAMTTRTAAACASVLAFLRGPHDAVLAARDVSAPVKAFMLGTLRRLGPRVTFLEPDALAAESMDDERGGPPSAASVAGAALPAAAAPAPTAAATPADAAARGLRAQLARPEVKVLYVESTSAEWNGMRVHDLARLDALAHAHGVRLVVDNTWGFGALPPPMRRAPNAVVVADGGAALFDGHDDVQLGLIACPDADTYRRVRLEARKYGATEPPLDAYMALRGVRTLHLRASEAAATAQAVAEWLAHATAGGDRGDRGDGDEEGQRALRACIARVIFPGLAAHPQHARYETLRAEWTDVVARGVPNGASGGTALLLQMHAAYSGGDAMRRFASALRLFQCAPSIAGMSCAFMPLRFDPRGRGTIVRLSFGLEHLDDVKRDLRTAFGAMEAAASAAPADRDHWTRGE